MWDVWQHCFSGTDDDDSKYDSPSNFGPKFRKLADMYGEEPSDEDSDGVGDRKSGNWFGRQILIWISTN